MSGHRSRRRGLRGEYLLRDQLRKRGYEANRVPSSGAAEGFKGDVVATKDGKELVFEVKNWKGKFKKIYQLYDAAAKEEGYLAFNLGDENMTCVLLSTDLDKVLNSERYYGYAHLHPLYSTFKRTFLKIANMRKLVKGCDVLALKDDFRPFLYVRFM